MIRRLLFCMLVALIIVCTAACSQENEKLSKQETTGYKSDVIKLDRGTSALNIELDTSNLQIFASDNKEISYEVKYVVRAAKKTEELKKMLDKFELQCDQKNKIANFSVNYAGKSDKKDIFTEVILKIPRQVTQLNISHKSGEIRINDRFIGTLVVDSEDVNCEINELDGLIDYTGESGSIRVDCAKLYGETNIALHEGNIYFKGDVKKGVAYSFLTDKGNINLNFPLDADLDINSYGTVAHNQFSGKKGEVKVKVAAKIGQIKIDGY